MADTSATNSLARQAPTLFMPDQAYSCDLEILITSLNRDLIAMELR